MEIITLDVSVNIFEPNMQDFFETYGDALEAALDSDIRIIMINAVQGSIDLFMLHYLYEKRGARAGDYIIYQNYASEYVDILATTTQERDIFRQMLAGTLTTTQPTYVGEIGDTLYAAYKTYDPLRSPPFYICYDYDSPFLLAHALDAALALGEDFENPNVLHRFLREVKFTGCSGDIVLEISTNDRRMPGYDLYQQYYPDLDKRPVNNTYVGYYNPLAATMFRLTALEWPDGSPMMEPPGDTIITDWECPFDPDLVKESDFGVLVGYSFCFGLFVV